MKLTKLLCGIILSSLIVACSESEKLSEKPIGPVQPPKKPLPVTCSKDLLVRLNWRGDFQAFAHTVEVGTEPGVYTETHALPADQTSFPFLLVRGATYYLRATKYTNSGMTTQFQTVQVVAPTCEERSAYQKAHPNYIEPFDQTIYWTNK